MKTKKWILSVLVVQGLTLQAHAWGKSDDAIEKAEVIASLEKQGDLRNAALQASVAAMNISQSIGSERVVAQVESRLDEIRNEVVTAEYSGKASFSLFFGLFSGKVKGSYNVTELLVANPREVDGFPAKVQRDLARLRSDLLSYLQKNEAELANMKLFAAKGLDLASRLDSSNRAAVLPYVLKAKQLAQRFTVYGMQTVSHCITTNHAKTKNELGFKLNLLFVKLKFSGTEKNKAYSETSCESSSAMTSVNEAALLSPALINADLLLAQYDQSLGLSQLTQEAPYYPTWGLGSY